MNGDLLECSIGANLKRHVFTIRLADLSPETEEWEGVSVAGYFVAAACLAFFALHLREGWHVGPMWVLVGLVYLGLAVYSVLYSWRRSGSFVIIRTEGENPRAVWIDRRIPDEKTVLAFVEDLKRLAASKQKA